MSDPPYEMVGYGGGTRFELSVPHLLTIGRPVEHLEYVGDLDWDGLRIALAGQRAARLAGLDKFQPARSIHRVMVEAARRFGRPLGWPADNDTRPNSYLADFLPEDIGGDVLRILRAGNRIPEEVLGPEELVSAWGK